MAKKVGVRFRRSGPVYYFDPGECAVQAGQKVVADTARGLALGRVVGAAAEASPEESLKPIVRLAGPEDFRRDEDNQRRGREAMAVCRGLLERFHLVMKLLDAEYDLDGSRLTIFFSAEGRVDFRPLVRELGAQLAGQKVELRQVGARDETKLIGGLGRCGRPLCCSNHLCVFQSVSMRMAKDQDLPLNPAKISGGCGRLLCCLAYEVDQYRQLRASLIPTGTYVATPHGEGKVVGGNPLKQTVMVELESKAVIEVAQAETTTLDQPVKR